MMILFIVFLLIIFGKLGWLAVKAAWGITKILVTIILFPIILIALAASGVFVVAVPILIILGIIALVCKPNI